eukprot:350592-Chlamydomonas_euryale.AAC.3
MHDPIAAPAGSTLLMIVVQGMAGFPRPDHPCPRKRRTTRAAAHAGALTGGPDVRQGQSAALSSAPATRGRHA